MVDDQEVTQHNDQVHDKAKGHQHRGQDILPNDNHVHCNHRADLHETVVHEAEEAEEGFDPTVLLHSLCNVVCGDHCLLMQGFTKMADTLHDYGYRLNVEEKENYEQTVEEYNDQVSHWVVAKYVQVAHKVSTKKDQAVEEKQGGGEPVHVHVPEVVHVSAHQDEVVCSPLKLYYRY